MLPERSSTIMASGAMEVKRPVSSALLTGAGTTNSMIAMHMTTRVTSLFFISADLACSARVSCPTAGQTMPRVQPCVLFMDPGSSTRIRISVLPAGIVGSRRARGFPGPAAHGTSGPFVSSAGGKSGYGPIDPPDCIRRSRQKRMFERLDGTGGVREVFTVFVLV